MWIKSRNGGKLKKLDFLSTPTIELSIKSRIFGVYPKIEMEEKCREETILRAEKR